MGQNNLEEHKYKFMAFTAKGLEHITEKEIKVKFPEAFIINKFDKRIIFSIDNISPKELLEFRTVDDIHFLFNYHIDIKNLNEHFIIKNLPLDMIEDAQKFISQYRHLNDTFSITTSKYKNESIDIESLKLRISKELSTFLKKEYTALDHTNFDIRIQIESSNVFFSCRIPTTSLYVRLYRKCQKNFKRDSR